MASGKNISVWIMNSKGGVGKTTLAVAVADIMTIKMRTPRIIEVDSRKRLSSFIGAENVSSFDGAPSFQEIRLNPNAVLTHYDPIIAELELGDSLLDLGANEDLPFLDYCRQSRVDEDLDEMNTQVVVLIPTLAEAESVNGAMTSIAKVSEIVPSAKIVLVLNERDGSDFDVYFGPHGDEMKAFLASGHAVLNMPKIMSEGWDEFQRKNMRFSDLLGMSASEMVTEFGFPRLVAKRARGDIAYWFGRMLDAVTFIPENSEEIETVAEPGE